MIATNVSGRSRIFVRQAQTLGGGGAGYDFIKISPKLHEIKRKLGTGGMHPLHPFRSTTGNVYVDSIF